MNTKTAAAAPAQCGQHTPGPWTIAQYGDLSPGTTPHVIIVYGVKKVATLMPMQHPLKEYQDCNISNVEMMSNARLIAAAPELLEALKFVLTTNEKQQRFTVATTRARAAIAKAEWRMS